MFGFLKKTTEFNLYAPVKGKCIDITEVKDKVFALKVMGDGFAIEPQEEVICSPCDGKIIMIPSSKHAFGIMTNDKKEILVHIGLDTVNLNGEGFEILKTAGTNVKAGDPVIKFDWKLLSEKEFVKTVIVIITSGLPDHFIKNKIGSEVDIDDIIIK